MPRDSGSDQTPKREHWASRAGFIMAAAGSAVGLGNVWKFPYMAGENGGGAFVMVYLPIVFTIGISILLAELIIGRAAQKDPVGSFRVLRGRAWPLVGFLGILAGFLILSFYSVVAGWTVAFATKMATGIFNGPGADPALVFGTFIGDPLQPLLYAGGFMVVAVAVVLGGIRHGIERANLVLMPMLFVILVVLVGRSLTLPGAMEGLRFFVTPDFSKVTGATLVIAKLDRLSRNAAFLLTLRDSGVRFVAADVPDANDLTVGIMALVAQQEREAISKRTKEALAVAKARGVKLGNPNGAAALRRAARGNVASLSAIKAEANQHAENLRPVVESLRENGITSLGVIADALNERGMLAPRDGRWYKSSVRNLIDRLQRRQAA